MPPMEVTAITATSTSMQRTVELPGRLQAVRSAQVRARVEGIVERRVYREGSDVRAGDVLFLLDRRTLESTAASARAGLERARADAVISIQTFDRMQALVGDNAVSRQEFDQATARRRQAEADVASAQAALRRAEIDLSYATVTAPIGGRIGRAAVTEGALVGKGEATPLATIEQIHPILVNFSQASADFLRLRESAKAARGRAPEVRVRLVLENGKPYPLDGKLLFSDLAIDPVTGSVGLRAEFPNPERDLLPGQFVSVRLPVAQTLEVIAVPQRAVLASAQGQQVMVVGADGRAQPRPVKTAGLAGTDWIVTEGLAPGDQVIVDGLQKLRPGAAVKAVPVAAAPPAPTTGSSPPPSPTAK